MIFCGLDHPQLWELVKKSMENASAFGGSLKINSPQSKLLGGKPGHKIQEKSEGRLESMRTEWS